MIVDNDRLWTAVRPAEQTLPMAAIHSWLLRHNSTLKLWVLWTRTIPLRACPFSDPFGDSPYAVLARIRINRVYVPCVLVPYLSRVPRRARDTDGAHAHVRMAGRARH